MAPTTTATGGEAAGNEVAGSVIVKTEVSSDDARTNSANVLAFTGGSSTPVLVVGIVLLILGATLSALSWQRRRAY